MAEQTNTSELTFKKASNELADVVSKLEGGDLDIEVAFDYYKRGCELLEYLQKTLASYQQQIDVLTQAAAPSDSE